MKLHKKLAFLAVLALLIRLFTALGAEAALDTLVQIAMQDEAIVTNAVFGQSPLLLSAAQNLEFSEDTPVPTPPAIVEEETYVPEYIPEFLPPMQRPIERPLPPLPDFSSSASPTASKIYLRNHTTYQVDIAELFYAPLSFDPSSGGSPTVLILHTHGTESFTPDALDWYENTDNYRTNDTNLNIVRVGAEVASALEARGIHVIHSRQIHDYPSFRGSYGRSLTAAEAYLARYPEIDIIFDIHRDAIMDASGNYVRTLAEIPDTQAAQVMLVVGTDHAGLYHPTWRNNLAFALQLQGEMAAFHPTFPRPMSLREERFNHHLTPGSVLVEIGTNSNTLQEALMAARIFAELAANVILAD